MFKASVQWIRSEFGGREKLPAAGIRPSIRFQKHVEKWIYESNSIEITWLDTDVNTWSGLAIFKENDLILKNYSVSKNDLFEFLDGYRVIGVGKILEII